MKKFLGILLIGAGMFIASATHAIACEHHAICLSPSTVNFPDTEVRSTSVSRTITARMENYPVKINSVRIYDFIDFSKVTDHCTGVILTHYNPTCTVTVQFNPLFEGRLSSEITFFDNSRYEPASATLRGRAIRPDLTVTPTAINFGDQIINTSSAGAYATITNTGRSTVHFTSISTSGDFSQINSCSTKLKSHHSCTVRVVFTPTSLGSLTGTLSIISDAKSGDKTVALSGTGISAGPPDVSVTPSSLNFDAQIVGTTSAPQSVKVTNTGASALTITSIVTSGDFNSSNNCGSSLAASSSCYVNTTFTPTAVGDRTGTITITDNATDSPQTVALTGTGTAKPAPIVSLFPSTIDFGDTPIGTSTAPIPSTLTNTGNATLTITSIAVDGDFSQTNTCGATVAAGASCVISTTFTPTEEGTLTGQVTITNNAPASPDYIDLTGIGVSPGEPDVSLSAYGVNFGFVDIGTTSAPQAVTVKNIGNATLTIDSIAASGGSFAQTNDCGATLAPSALCTITATFTPESVGFNFGTITLTDDASDSPQTIYLEGFGISMQPQLQLNPASLAFGSHAVGQTTSAQVVTATNTGNAPLTFSSISTTGDYAQTNTCTGAIAGGNSCTISVTFTPTTTGSRPGTLSVTSNASPSPQTVDLTGTGVAPGTPEASFSTKQLSFGPVIVNVTSSAQTVILTNSGTVNLTITSVAASGDFAETSTCSGTLAPTATCSTSVTFTPTSSGPLTGTLTFTDNASDSPQTIALSGVGIDSPIPSADVSTSTLAFGYVTVDTTSTSKTITITNTGSVPLQCNGSSVTSGAPYTTVDLCGTEEIPVGGTCTISVTFAPTTVGTKSDTLTIDNDATSSPFSVSLIGSGTSSNITGGGGCSLIR